MTDDRIATEADVVTKLSPRSVHDTTVKLTAMISAKGMKIFAIIDQAAEARQAGLTLRETMLVMEHPAAGYAAAYGLFIAAAVASIFGAQVREKLTLGGAGGGVFELDNSDGVTLTATRVATAGPLAAEVTDALAGRAPVAAVLGELPAGSRAALSGLRDFFNTPVEPSLIT